MELHTVNVFEDNTLSDPNKTNLHIYGNDTVTNVNIDKSLCINNHYEREAVLDVFMESDYYSEEIFGTIIILPGNMMPIYAEEHQMRIVGGRRSCHSFIGS